MHRGRATGKWLSGEYFFYDHTGAVEKSRISLSPGAQKTPFAKAYESIRLLAARLPTPGGALLETILHAAFLLSSIFMIRAGIRIVRQRSIQCIMGISDIGPALISTYFISRCTGIPYVLYFFDIYLGNNLRPINDLLAKIFEPLLIRNASLVILTNEGAERFYRRRYGDAFKSAVVHNSIFPDDYEGKRTTYAPNQPYSVLFAGHVYWAQERSLMNLMQAIEGLRDLGVQPNLYVPDLSTASDALRNYAASHPHVGLKSAAQWEMPGIQSKATILFLPLSWHTSPQIVATATPGKLADYLASGRPILIHAPPYAYVSEYAKKSGFALVIDEENISKLQDAVKKLILDVDYSRELVENALRILYKNHDAHKNARELARMLSELP